MTPVLSLPRLVMAVMLFACLAGVLVFAATSSYPQMMYLGPLCRSQDVRPPGFDPWTGEPVGDIFRCDPVRPDDPPSHLVTLDVPDDLIGRRAIPVPVGFAFGALLATGLLVAMRFVVRTQRIARVAADG
jgi:hypothetical protein